MLEPPNSRGHCNLGPRLRGGDEQKSKRLPSAAEYEAIVQAAKESAVSDVASGEPAKIEDLFGGVAEWTTTKWHARVKGPAAVAIKIQNSHELAGYGDPDKLPGLTRMPDNKLIAPPEIPSSSIGFRGVRSGTPRFVKP